MSLFQGFNKRYQDELKEIIGTIDNVITNENIEDFVAYKKLVGKRSAFMDALERHQELLTLMEQAND